MAHSSSLNNNNNNNNSRNPRNLSSNFPTTTTSSLIQSTLCKSSISSLLLSTFSNNNHSNNNNNNRNGGSKKSSTLLGFSCTAQQEVSVPSVIRSSANWDDKTKDKKSKNDIENTKKKKKIKKKTNRQNLQGVLLMDDSVVQDFWCGVDSGVSASVDCLQPLPFRHKLDLHTHLPQQHGTYSSRQRLNTEHYGGLELDAAFDASHVGPDVFEARYYHHLRNQSPERLAEILMFQNGLLTSRRSSGADRYRDLRLDVDSMTYEELLDLGERIGHVNTGLRDDQIGRCLRKAKLSVVEVEPTCSICQEEYNGDDEMGKLKCGHAYHLPCIKQWLARKNTCPVCKAEASSQ